MLRLFKSKLFILLMITIVLLIIIGVSARQTGTVGKFESVFSVVLTPAQKFLSFCGEKVQGSTAFFSDIKTLKKENKDLKARIDELEREKNELEGYRSENMKLKEQLNIVNSQFSSFKTIGANVIAKDPGNWFNMFTIDRGTKDKISNNDAIITAKGLVGRVNSAGLISSKVMSIIDSNSTVAARLVKSRYTGLVRGDMTLMDQGLCRMDYISPEADIAVGDTVETSGMGGIFPKGIVIGKVKQVMQANNELTRYAIIKPTVDFQALEDVLILKGK